MSTFTSKMKLYEVGKRIRWNKQRMSRATCPLERIAVEAAVDADVFLYLRLHGDQSVTRTPPQLKWAFGVRYSSLSDNP